MSERIYLRACIVNGPKDDEGQVLWGYAGVALPDGRIIMAGGPDVPISLTTFSSERALQRLHPGSRVQWVPEADATVNSTEGEDT